MFEIEPNRKDVGITRESFSYPRYRSRDERRRQVTHGMGALFVILIVRFRLPRSKFSVKVVTR